MTPLVCFLTMTSYSQQTLRDDVLATINQLKPPEAKITASARPSGNGVAKPQKQESAALAKVTNLLKASEVNTNLVFKYVFHLFLVFTFKGHSFLTGKGN